MTRHRSKQAQGEVRKKPGTCFQVPLPVQSQGDTLHSHGHNVCNNTFEVLPTREVHQAFVSRDFIVGSHTGFQYPCDWPCCSVPRTPVPTPSRGQTDTAQLRASGIWKHSFLSGRMPEKAEWLPPRSWLRASPPKDRLFFAMCRVRTAWAC